MIYRTLGRTGLQVGVVGLGTEYLQGASRDTVVAVLHEALDRGAGYIDALYAFPDYRDNLGAGLAGRRDKAVITGHLGCGVTADGQYLKTKNVSESERFFEDLLTRLHTDYVDVLMLQWIDSQRELSQVMKPGGLLSVAKRYQQQGKARHIGISVHKVPIALQAVQSGEFDVLMFPVNMAWNVIPGRNEMLAVCEENGVGVVAMKPYGGGRLLQEEGPVTPAKCLAYALDQRAVATVAAGAKNLAEMQAALHYVDATDEERDYGAIIATYQEDLRGNCVYCNHCLPCPSGIDIGYTLRRLDALTPHYRDGVRISRRARSQQLDFYYGADKPTSAAFDRKAAGPETCTECGACARRCPFDVDVVAKMKQAVEVFAKG
ncbi:MAG: aldo/keto reductase [Anaerolineae bacterium]